MQVTITKLSELTCISRDTVRRRCSPLLKEGRGQLVESSEALPLIFGNGDSRLDPSQEKARLDRTRRELAELDYKQKQRELISVEDACKIIDIAATSCREHLMGIPGRWADVIAAETDARAVEEILEREIRAGLQRVADARDRFQR